ncbi:hypothetical protein, variant [Aphanomyces invadans]|uniref:protein O-GlcNAc transferase n=1 Tax=Aphanomyces invadans TaxID=157072 RepID=A0A024UF36_9STRA|nr:hypothetical protein, variant [Aphanomyces invadans]ETW05011.1 hypothetical protein, variant [Aphanomyces invadans]|eukprot:XP_008866448.1 hypothetical protein, variant [Aphanomyces invadans]
MAACSLTPCTLAIVLLILFTWLNIEAVGYTYPSTAVNHFQVIAALEEYTLGQKATDEGRIDDAIAHYQQSIQAYAKFGPSYNNMGILLHKRGNNDEAKRSHEIAAEVSLEEGDWETFASAHNNLGYLVRLGHAKSYEKTLLAVHHFDLALQVTPPNCTVGVYVSALYNKGSALYGIGQLDQAQQLLRHVLTLDPSHGSAHLDMGNIYFHQGHLDKALYHQHLLVQLGTTIREVVGALNNQGQFLKEIGYVKDALVSHTQALHLQPTDGNTLLNVITARRQLCLWDDADDWHGRLLELTSASLHASTLDKRLANLPALLPYDATLMAISDEMKRDIAVSNSLQWEQSSPYFPLKASAASAAPLTKLNIGYFGYDFRNHPMGQLTIGALEHHNHSRIHLHAYAYGPNDLSTWRNRSEAACDVFRDLFEASDVDIAAQIHADGIHIAVDLMAHTRGARVGISGLKPAPILVNYLGYPGTMGSSFTDYAIVDRFVVPPMVAASTFTEKLVYLPHTYQVNMYEWSVDTVAKHTFGDRWLFVFCNFNTINKMEPVAFGVWMAILRRVPHGVLWLLEPSRVDAGVVRTFRTEAAARGVNPDRLIFASRLPHDQHLTRLRNAHLFLDSIIYTAHTTASDMIWAHLPIVTLWGSTFASRVAGSLMDTALGSTLWTTHSIKEYEDLAVRLATTDRATLNSFRFTLAQRAAVSPLFDSRRTTFHLEHAYACMASLGSGRLHIIVDPRDYNALQRPTLQDMVQRTLALHENGDFEAATLGYARILAVEPSHPDALHLFGLARYQQHNYGDALDYMLASLQVAKNVGFFHGNLGQVYHALHDYASAAHEFATALALDPNQPQVFLNYMTLLQATKQQNVLVQVFGEFGEKLAGALPAASQWDLQFEVAYALVGQGELQKAMDCLAAIDAMTPPVDILVRARYNSAAILSRLGQHDQANYVSMKTVRLEHEAQQVHANLLKFHGEDGHRPRLVIYCYEYGQGWWGEWGPYSTETGVGGSEEAVIYMSRELVAVGYRVEIFGNPPEAMTDSYGVHWFPHTWFDPDEPSDVFIAWRYHISTALASRASAVFVWLHDMVNEASFTPSYVDTIDGIFCLSQAHAAGFAPHAMVKIISTGNGLVPSAFASHGANSPTHFVYGSSPNRGLETVLESWGDIRRRIPNATLHVYYGFTQAFVRFAQPSDAWRQRMDILLQQDGITYYGLVDHDTLAKGYASAGFYLYPTTYFETSCVSIMKAMANGAIPITSKRGALHEVVASFDLGPQEALEGAMSTPLLPTT